MPRELPPLPSQAFSHLGPLKVTLEPLQGDDLGQFDQAPRIISITPSQCLIQQWQTYWHECVHAALFDAGVKIPEKTEEIVCDVLGTYLAAAIRTGFLKVQYDEETDHAERGPVPDAHDPGLR